jgi:protein-tyrosine phosphatase
MHSDATLGTARERRIALQGAINFRDLGGYPGAAGRRLRWGRVYRSDLLTDLSKSDLATIRALGLRHICDLRADSERAQKPARAIPGASLHAVGFMPSGGEALMRDLARLSVDEVVARVTAIYEDFVLTRSAHFARLFQLLLQDDALPLLFHCASGRDRTGTFAALLLSALGVPRTVIEQDYLLSDQYRRDVRFQFGEGIAPELMAAVTRSHPAYLAAVFDRIEQHWGSTDDYLREALGLSDAARARLQDRLLEAATP